MSANLRHPLRLSPSAGVQKVGGATLPFEYSLGKEVSIG